MSDARFEMGTVLAGKYRLESRLGEGGMGTVYRAQHLVLNAPVAIKVIEREVAEGDLALSRFMREAQAAASLRSPHVVQILDYGTEDDRPYMVMELLEGETLADRIKRAGPLSALETHRVMTHVSRAVAKAHEAGIVHRDLKPDNVFLVFNEGDEIAKVLDFGVAKMEATALGGGSHTRTGSLLGTPYYMSPEQAQGNKEIDHRSDLWALAVIAFECLTSEKPFDSEGLGDLVLQICIRDIPIPSQHGDVPSGFDEWFARGTAREPDNRFQSARELSDSLGEALGLVQDGPESSWAMRSASLAALGSSPVAGRDSRADDESKEFAHSTTSPDEQAESNEGPDGAAAPSSVAAVTAEGRDAVAQTGSLQRGSQWEVVPHDAGGPEPGTASDFGPASNPSASPDMVGEAPKRSTAVLWVALLAAAVGVAAVVGARQVGVELVPGAAPSPTPRSSQILGEEAVQQPTETSGGSKTAKNEAAGGNAASSKSASEAGPDPESAEDGDSDPEQEALDAIDEAAKNALDEKEKHDGQSERTSGDAGQEPGKNGSDDKSTPPQEGSSKDARSRDKADSAEQGPKPRLPDSLTPSPPPPPPSE